MSLYLPFVPMGGSEPHLPLPVAGHLSQIPLGASPPGAAIPILVLEDCGDN